MQDRKSDLFTFILRAAAREALAYMYLRGEVSWFSSLGSCQQQELELHPVSTCILSFSYPDYPQLSLRASGFVCFTHTRTVSERSRPRDWKLELADEACRVLWLKAPLFASGLKEKTYDNISKGAFGKAGFNGAMTEKKLKILKLVAVILRKARDTFNVGLGRGPIG